LKRHKSTISREVRRNRGLRGYRPKQAQHLALARREAKAKPRIAPGTWEWVESLLREEWSPEQVSGWLSMEQGLHVSHEWIYQYVYADKRRGGDLHAHLRCQKRRRKRYGSNERRGQIRGRVWIDERPEIVEERSRTRDWEADTVIGKPGGPVLLTLAERRTRYSIIAKAPDKSAQAVTDALLTVLHLSTRSPMTTARSSPTIRPSPRDSTPKATSPTPTIPGSADSTRTPTDSSVSICPRAPISELSHLRRSAASWTDSTTGHGNVLASRLQISSSQESTHLLHLRVESATCIISL
jgi:hypothetical protein